MKKISLVLSMVMVLNILFSSIIFASSESNINVNTQVGNLTRNANNLINYGDSFTITATHTSGIKTIGYMWDTGNEIERNMYGMQKEQLTVNIPNEYKDGNTHALYVYALNGDGVWNSSLLVYYFTVKMNYELVPNITLKGNGDYMNYMHITELKKDDKISVDISTYYGVSKVNYYFDNNHSDVFTKKSGKFDMIIPDEYKDGRAHYLRVQVEDINGKLSDWYVYSFVIIDAQKEIDAPVVTLKRNSSKIDANTKNNYYTFNEKDAFNININYDLPISEIIYTIANTGDKKGEYTITGNNGNLTIPETYKDGELYVLGVYFQLKNGNYSDILAKYYFRYDSAQYSKPIIKARAVNRDLSQKVNYEINLNEKMQFNATCQEGIKSISYSIDGGAFNEKLGDNLDFILDNKYNDGKRHTITIFSTSNKGVDSDYYYYIFTIKDNSPIIEPENPNNTKYDVITQSDERINTNIPNLSVSLRNVSNVNGNKNRYTVSEPANYYIDFINGGSDISSNVTLTFNIPENVSVKFIDSKGGVVSGNRISWTFNGLKSKECGTIPIVLSYTAINSDYIMVTPTAEISSSNLKDTSAVKNMVYKTNANLNVNHTTYMYGDSIVDTFRPNDGLNRAEMAAVITRVFNLNRPTNYTVTYSDANVIATNPYRWSTPDIMAVTQLGLMQGYEDGTFRPGGQVTKAEFITVLARKFAVDNTGSVNPFTIKNAPIKLFNTNSNNHWSLPYLSQLTRLNMIGNVLKANENPDSVITRAEVAHLINSCMFRGPATDGTNGNLTKIFSDVNTSTPYYSDILEATAENHNAKFNSNGMEIMIK